MYATKSSGRKRWLWAALSAFAGAGVMSVGPQARWQTFDTHRRSAAR
jgi:hypothetical protein